MFSIDPDRQYYLKLLRKHSTEFGLSIQAYCLMTNHVHLVATPAAHDSLAKAIGRTNLHYTWHVNNHRGRTGHLWEDRFFSSPLDDEYYWNSMIYAERNPVRAGIAANAWDYPWSSAAAHVSGRDFSGLLDLSNWRKPLPPDLDWREAISKPQDKAMEDRLRTWSCRGCPLGSDSFISRLEGLLDRRLRPARRGRPPRGKSGR